MNEEKRLKTKNGKEYLFKEVKVSDLQTGDTILADDGELLKIDRIGGGMLINSRMLEYSNGKWSNARRNDLACVKVS